MDRRDLLRAAASATALALLPRDALAAWARVAAGAPRAGALTAAQLALVGAVADTILPRTDTPGATDVGVPAFVDVIAAEYYDDAERTAFLAGLDALDAQVRAAAGASFADLSADQRALQLEAVERMADRRAEPARSYWRLKGLVVHGYFTSEPVMVQVLKVEVMPGKFDGAAPMPLKRARADAGGRGHA